MASKCLIQLAVFVMSSMLQLWHPAMPQVWDAGHRTCLLTVAFIAQVAYELRDIFRNFTGSNACFGSPPAGSDAPDECVVQLLRSAEALLCCHLLPSSVQEGICP